MMSRKDAQRPKPRSEPTLGPLDTFDAPAPPMVADGLPRVEGETRSRREAPTPPPTARSGRIGWLVPAVLLLLIVLGTLLWLNQDALRGMLPRTQFNGVLARADAALQAGNLDGRDGTSARELYQAARALEPDSDRALDGLRRVGRAELVQADAQIGAGKLDDAAQSAAAARELLGGGSAVDRVDHAIADARAAQVHTGDLVDRARQALADGRLDGTDGAAALFQRVFAADPGNAIAAHGLDQVGGAYAAQARKAMAANDLDRATTVVDKLAALLPHYNELPGLRAELAQAQEQRTAALSAAIAQGDTALRAGQIDGPGADTALAHYNAALALDPASAEARAGLGRIAQALIVQANAALDSGQPAQAKALLDRAQPLAPQSADLAAARARLGAASAAPAVSPASAGSAAAGAGAGETVQPLLTPAQHTQVAAQVAQAKAAAARGNIMLPPGRSAYDLYRSALAIDGNDATARAGLEQLPDQVVQLFNQALQQHDLASAGSMLDNLADLAPANTAQPQLRQRLVEAWLDRAEQQLQSGDRPGASQSLDQARQRAPANPRLQQLANRLAAGG